jgi:hypothetical protein
MLEAMWEYFQVRAHHWVLKPLPGVNEDEARDFTVTPWDDVDRELLEAETIGGE